MTDFSQNGESKVLKTLFDKLGIKQGTYLDIGAGDGYQFSNTAYFRQSGWTGVEVDADPRGSKIVKKMKITKENIHELFDRKYNLVSLDVDGNDAWLLMEILKFKPDVVIFEVNSQLPLDKSWAMPYNPDHEWDGSNYFGMSYRAAFRICIDNIYKVYDVVKNQNIIAVNKDLKIESLPYIYKGTWSHPDTDKQFQEI